MKGLLNSKFSIGAKGYTKAEGKPFKISELKKCFTKELENLNTK